MICGIDRGAALSSEYGGGRGAVRGGVRQVRSCRVQVVQGHHLQGQSEAGKDGSGESALRKVASHVVCKCNTPLSLSLQSPFFDGKQTNWYHYSCFFKTCQPRSTSEVGGYGNLRPSDQDRLKSSIQGGKVYRV